MDRAYVLHSYPYRETSLIQQVWPEKHGRVGLVAKRAKRPRSPARSVLVPFQALAVSWFGRGELRTLKTAEAAAPATPLGGASLMSAFYLNELLLKLTHRDDPHENLFAAYDTAITELRAITRGGAPAAAIEPVLHGIPYYQKPPLFYWLVMLCYAALGPYDWAARLVPATAAVLTVLVTSFPLVACWEVNPESLASVPAGLPTTIASPWN